MGRAIVAVNRNRSRDDAEEVASQIRTTGGQAILVVNIASVFR